MRSSLSMENNQELLARRVFDEMTRNEFEEYRSPNRILEVTIHKVCYPITESILRQIFGQFGKVENVYVCMGIERAEATVVFQSKLEAAEAFGELHGRNIYDGCCQIEIMWGIRNIPECVSARTTPELLPAVACFPSTSTGPFEFVGTSGPLSASRPQPGAAAEPTFPIAPRVPSCAAATNVVTHKAPTTSPPATTTSPPTASSAVTFNTKFVAPATSSSAFSTSTSVPAASFGAASCLTSNDPDMPTCIVPTHACITPVLASKHPSSATAVVVSSSPAGPAVPTCPPAPAAQGAEEEVSTNTPTKCSIECFSHDIDVLKSMDTVTSIWNVPLSLFSFTDGIPLDINRNCSLKHLEGRYITTITLSLSSSIVLSCVAVIGHEYQKVLESRINWSTVVFGPLPAYVFDKEKWPPPTQWLMQGAGAHLRPIPRPSFGYCAVHCASYQDKKDKDFVLWTLWKIPWLFFELVCWSSNALVAVTVITRAHMLFQFCPLRFEFVLQWPSINSWGDHQMQADLSFIEKRGWLVLLQFLSSVDWLSQMDSDNVLLGYFTREGHCVVRLYQIHSPDDFPYITTLDTFVSTRATKLWNYGKMGRATLSKYTIKLKLARVDPGDIQLISYSYMCNFCAFLEKYCWICLNEVLPLTLIECYGWDVQLYLHWKYIVLSECCACAVGTISDQSMIVVLLLWLLDCELVPQHTDGSWCHMPYVILLWYSVSFHWIQVHGQAREGFYLLIADPILRVKEVLLVASFLVIKLLTSLKHLQAPWDPSGLDIKHRLGGKSIFKKGEC